MFLHQHLISLFNPQLFFSFLAENEERNFRPFERFKCWIATETSVRRSHRLANHIWSVNEKSAVDFWAMHEFFHFFSLTANIALSPRRKAAALWRPFVTSYWLWMKSIESSFSLFHFLVSFQMKLKAKVQGFEAAWLAYTCRMWVSSALVAERSEMCLHDR